MQLLQIGDIIRTETITDKTKFFSFRVYNVHHIYTKPNEYGEVYLQDIRYFVIQLYTKYPTEAYLSHHDIGHDFWLHERKRADGLIQQFNRPQALAQG